MPEKPVTGAKVRLMLEDIVGKVTADWDKRLERLWERGQGRDQDLRDLRARVHRLERIAERIGHAALQEKP